MKKTVKYGLGGLGVLFTLLTLNSISTFGAPQKSFSPEVEKAAVSVKDSSIVTLIPTKSEGITEEVKAETSHLQSVFEEDLSLPFLPSTTETPWADSVFKSLTPREKIAQLFMVAAYSNKGKDHEAALKALIKKEKIGGLIFFKGDPISQINLTNQYQMASKTPLWLGMDIEWGLSMRLSNSVKYPYQMSLGAMENDSLVYYMGAQIAEQMKRMGVHVSFSPVLDVNNNPNNPVINYRSFGENRENVSDKGLMYIKGLQENGVLACAKHFPGHGDTDMDSHLALPTVPHDRNRLDSIELFPFKHAINEGVGSVMVAHLHIPVIDNRENRATTLSNAAVNSLLKGQLEFNGLSFTDALNMKGVSQYFKPGEVDLEALKAGNDVLLFPEDVPQAINLIEKSLKSGELEQSTVDRKVLKILKTKEWLGLDSLTRIDKNDAVNDLNTEKYDWLNQKLADASLTLLRNEEEVLPIKDFSDKKIAIVNIGENRKSNKFNETINHYAKAKIYNITKKAGFNEIKEITEKIADYDYVFVNVLGTSNKPKNNFGITENINLFCSKLQGDSKYVLNIFTNAYSLYKLEHINKFSSVILAYEDTPQAQKSAADACVGSLIVNGKIPVSAGMFLEGEGISLSKTIRVRFDVSPHEVGMNPSDLLRIDSLALNGISEKAYPGCRVLAIKDGQVVIDRSYGYHTYSKKKPITSETVYDLASITKIAATTLSLIRLNDQSIFDPEYSLCDYLPEIPDSSDYFNMKMKDILSHTAGLKPWIPFYANTLNEDNSLSKNYYKTFPAEGYNKVAKNLYITKSYEDSIYSAILNNPLREKTNYRYSDLGYYLIYKMFPTLGNAPLEEYVTDQFYTPMGLNSIGYHPVRRLNKSLITPTENDKVYRKQIVTGHVHDPGAAMLGGACAHAGLFSNAQDLGIIMQLFLNRGSYAGQQFFNGNTFDYYNTKHFNQNRRGIGFDKPVMKSGEGPACDSVSASSFGHSGFTGTLTWADPEHNLVYVFLSNRVYPDAGNRKLVKMNIRTNIQQVIYDAIEKAEQPNT